MVTGKKNKTVNVGTWTNNTQRHLPQDTGSYMHRGRWYHRPCRQLVDKRGARVNHHLDQKNAGGRTSEGHHLDVVTGHELDVHRLPQSTRVWGPPDLTSASLIIDMSRIRSRRDGVSKDNQCQGQNESRESATRKHWNKTFAARYTEVERENEQEANY
jgi:hypothetical protein